MALGLCAALTLMAYVALPLGVLDRNGQTETHLIHLGGSNVVLDSTMQSAARLASLESREGRGPVTVTEYEVQHRVPKADASAQPFKAHGKPVTFYAVSGPNGLAASGSGVAIPENQPVLHPAVVPAPAAPSATNTFSIGLATPSAQPLPVDAGLSHVAVVNAAASQPGLEAAALAPRVLVEVPSNVEGELLAPAQRAGLSEAVGAATAKAIREYFVGLPQPAATLHTTTAAAAAAAPTPSAVQVAAPSAVQVAAPSAVQVAAPREVQVAAPSAEQAIEWVAPPGLFPVGASQPLQPAHAFTVAPTHARMAVVAASADHPEMEFVVSVEGQATALPAPQGSTFHLVPEPVHFEHVFRQRRPVVARPAEHPEMEYVVPLITRPQISESSAQLNSPESSGVHTGTAAKIPLKYRPFAKKAAISEATRAQLAGSDPLSQDPGWPPNSGNTDPIGLTSEPAE